MKLNIGICDDDKAMTSLVFSETSFWADHNNHTVEIKIFPSAEAFLFECGFSCAFDILLLDIEMGKMNGVELAKKVRAANKEVQIIFISGYSDYISDGYDVEALHYLIKPLDREKLFSVLDRACEKLKKNEKAIILKTADGTVRFPLYEIKFFEVRANYVTVHTNAEISVRTTLSAIENELDDRFFRIGRSFIVNLKYIRKITRKEVILTDGALIPLPRGIYDVLNRAFIEHF